MAKRQRAVYRLRITLKEIHPPVWRLIEVWEDTRLPRLHEILQALFEWEDYHLHEFQVGKRTYSVPDPEDAWFGRKILDEHSIPINRLLSWPGDSMEYLYDFGDNWFHDIRLEAIALSEPDAFYPRCLAGARCGPPEDAGGVRGYERYLTALSDPSHPEHEDMLAWRGPFDPEHFSLADLNAGLHRTFFRRKRGEAQAAKANLVRIRTIEEGARLPLALTAADRDLILKHTFAEQELLAPLQVSPPPAVFWYTPGDIEALLGHIAAQANHCKDAALRKQLQTLLAKLT